MAKTEELSKKSVRIPFFLATDEGDIYSENVAAIMNERVADQGDYKGETVTVLRTKSNEVKGGNNAQLPYVLASAQTVRALFQSHGYDLPTYKRIKTDDLREIEGKSPDEIAAHLGLKR